MSKSEKYSLNKEKKIPQIFCNKRLTEKLLAQNQQLPEEKCPI
jgi:hypothetical protein